MKIRPLDDRLVVKPLEAETKTASGIYLPESAKEKPKEGEIIAVGDGKILDDGSRGSMTVKKGDRILFTSYAGTEIKIDGNEYLIMSEEDVLAVVQ